MATWLRNEWDGMPGVLATAQFWVCVVLGTIFEIPKDCDRWSFAAGTVQHERLMAGAICLRELPVLGLFVDVL